MIKLVIAIMPLIGLGFLFAHAEEAIPITYSGTMDRVMFDGKWTFEYEWKQSSLNTYLYDDGSETIVLRSAHQDDFVYIFIDAVTDESLDNKLDYATICFDSENNKNIIPDSDDHCFTSILGNNTGVILRGDQNDGFTQIDNHPDFIAIGGTSDQNDRYSGVPHAGYEFRIPTEIIGRYNVYGFSFAVYDGNTKKFYTYPADIITSDGFSSPAGWGEIYSPDKSLPEFYLAPLVMILSVASVILITKIRKIVF
jgi:hypothetical protein